MGFANASRGLRIEGTDFEYLSEGAYAVAFYDRKSGKVRKVFKRNAENDKNSADSFEVECNAYELASKVDRLRALIPAYFGTVRGAIIRDQHGVNLSREFCTDRIIEMEYVSGQFQKINGVRDAEDIKALFHKHGIMGMSDASVTLAGGKILKVIDFGLREIDPQW